MRRRTRGSRAQRYESRLPGLAGWMLGLVAGLGLLVALAYVNGNAVSSGDDFLASVHTTVTRPVVASALALAALILVAWCCRHLLLELLAWWPGRIIVEEFEASPAVDPAQLPRLTAEFRDRLARSHLQSPAPVPAPTQHGDFLDVLSGGGLEPGGVLASLLGLLRAAVPTHAYVVKGALLSRDKPRGCGVTVHVVRLPAKGSRPRTFWDSTWEGAIRRAADHATASVLPRTRLCSSPWSGWRGYRLPSDLLHAYERGAELEEERRYDEALDHYQEALREDPMNIALRLQIGFLQEKLALFLDALATYEGILAVTRPGQNAVEADRPAAGRRRRDPLRRVYRSPARRDRDRVLLVARYRRAVLLGGQELPRQWRQLPQAPATRRDKQRHQLRDQLRPVLTDLLVSARESRAIQAITRSTYEGLDVPKDRPASLEPPSATLGRSPLQRLVDRLRPRGPIGEREHECSIDKALAEPTKRDPKRRALQLRELLALAALHELAELRRELGGPRLRRDDALSAEALDLSGVWVQHHLRVLLARLTRRKASAWVPAARDLDRSLQHVESRAGFQRWQENYNAACVYSLPLLLTGDERPQAEEKQALARRAVRHLEQAIACADSAYVASRRDWVLSDDPDLDGLRADSSFKRYEAMFFPSAWRTPRRPRDLHKWELSSYTFELLSAVAARWEQTWLRRKEGLDFEVGVAEPAGWCKVEREAWRRVRQVAVDHRHWETRVGLIRQMERWQPVHRFDPVAVAFPCFAGSHGWAPEEDTPVEVADTVRDNDERLSGLASILEDAREQAKAESLIDDLTDLNAELVRLDATRWTVPRREARRLCEAHATLWRMLGRYLADTADSPGELRGAIDETLALWSEIRRRWQPHGEVAAAASNGGPPVEARMHAA
jgi:hypothetical protein